MMKMTPQVAHSGELASSPASLPSSQFQFRARAELRLEAGEAERLPRDTANNNLRIAGSSTSTQTAVMKIIQIIQDFLLLSDDIPW